MTAFLLSAGETVSDGLFPDVSSAAPAPQAVNQYEQEVAANLRAHTRIGIPSDISSMLAACTSNCSYCVGTSKQPRN